MNCEETIFPRREYIYVGDTQNAHSRYIQHRMSIDCFGPPFKFGDFTDLDLKQNAFLRQQISPC